MEDVIVPAFRTFLLIIQLCMVVGKDIDAVLKLVSESLKIVLIDVPESVER